MILNQFLRAMSSGSHSPKPSVPRKKAGLSDQQKGILAGALVLFGGLVALIPSMPEKQDIKDAIDADRQRHGILKARSPKP